VKNKRYKERREDFPNTKWRRQNIPPLGCFCKRQIGKEAMQVQWHLTTFGAHLIASKPSAHIPNAGSNPLLNQTKMKHLSS
jgi:hypothetical protein